MHAVTVCQFSRQEGVLPLLLGVFLGPNIEMLTESCGGGGGTNLHLTRALESVVNAPSPEHILEVLRSQGCGSTRGVCQRSECILTSVGCHNACFQPLPPSLGYCCCSDLGRPGASYFFCEAVTLHGGVVGVRVELKVLSLQGSDQPLGMSAS